MFIYPKKRPMTSSDSLAQVGDQNRLGKRDFRNEARKSLRIILAFALLGAVGDSLANAQTAGAQSLSPDRSTTFKVGSSRVSDLSLFPPMVQIPDSASATPTLEVTPTPEVTATLPPWEVAGMTQPDYMTAVNLAITDQVPSELQQTFQDQFLKSELSYDPRTGEIRNSAGDIWTNGMVPLDMLTSNPEQAYKSGFLSTVDTIITKASADAASVTINTRMNKVDMMNRDNGNYNFDKVTFLPALSENFTAFEKDIRSTPFPEGTTINIDLVPNFSRSQKDRKFVLVYINGPNAEVAYGYGIETVRTPNGALTINVRLYYPGIFPNYTPDDAASKAFGVGLVAAATGDDAEKLILVESKYNYSKIWKDLSGGLQSNGTRWKPIVSVSQSK